jgi:hypothetical protein
LGLGGLGASRFVGVQREGGVGGGVGVGFGVFGEAGGDGVVVDVALVGGEVFGGADLVVCIASLLDGEF